MIIARILTSSLTVAFVMLAASTIPARAAEPDVASEPLTEAERAAFLAELQPLQDRLAALRKAPNVSPDRWADAQIFVKGVVWALDFGPVTDARSRGLVKFGLARARERIDALAAGRQPWTERRGRSAARLHLCRGWLGAALWSGGSRRLRSRQADAARCRSSRQHPRDGDRRIAVPRSE